MIANQQMPLINGQPKQQVAVSDRGFTYGDGVFTTIRVVKGALVHYKQHLQRLQLGCEKLFINFSAWEEVTSEAQLLAKGSQQAVVKIQITRGSGGRGYCPAVDSKVSRVVSIHPFPAYYAQWQQGISIGVAETRLGLNPLTAGLKHLNRLEQVMIKHELEQANFSDGVVLNINDEVICSSAGNIFWYSHGQWYTPSLELCGIKGIMRQLFIDYCEDNQIICSQVKATLTELMSAQSVFICNSLMGLVPVASISNKRFQTFDLAEIRNQLQANV